MGDPSLSHSRPKTQLEADWINASAFQPVYGNDQSYWANPNPNDPRWWQFGTAGAFLPGLRAPGFWNLDTSLVKEFHLTEQRYFQFRWEMFNALNHQNLGLPNTNFCLPPGPERGNRHRASGRLQLRPHHEHTDRPPLHAVRAEVLFLRTAEAPNRTRLLRARLC